MAENPPKKPHKELAEKAAATYASTRNRMHKEVYGLRPDEVSAEEFAGLNAARNVVDLLADKYDRVRSREEKKAILSQMGAKLGELESARDTLLADIKGSLTPEQEADLKKTFSLRENERLAQKLADETKARAENPNSKSSTRRKPVAKPRAKTASVAVAQGSQEIEASTPVGVKSPQGPDFPNPWARYGNQGEIMRQKIGELYPSGEAIPTDILDKYDELLDRQQESFKTGDEAEQAAVAEEIGSFISGLAKKEEPFDPHSVLSVDESTLNASQYTANPKMQADMDALSASEARNALEADVQKQINRNKKTRARGEVVAGAGERVTEDIPMMDGTPKEWKQKLNELIGKFGEGAKEKAVGGAERMKTYLAGRSGELDTAIAAKTEKGFRSLGEWYGKLGWKSKLAVGLSLGIGMGVSAAAGASIPAALGLIFTGTGIAVQRVAGLSAQFLKYERSSLDGKWLGIETKKETKAMWKAAGQTALMTGAMLLLVEGVKEAINFADQSNKDEAILRWIGSMTGNKTLAPDAAPAGPGVTVPVAGEAVPAATNVPELSSIKIEATKGHGYEYMMKRLWEELNEKNITLPPNADANSDLARLLKADDASIDKVIHDLATENKFYNLDGTSARIGLGEQMTINAEGDIFLGDSNMALDAAPVTPPYHPEALVAPHTEAPVPTPEALDLYFGTQSAAPQEINPLTGLVNEQTPAPVETAVPHTAPEQIISPEPIKTVDLTPAQDAANQGAAEAAQAPILESHSIVNSFGTKVSIDTPHIYADSEAENNFVFGGSTGEQANVIKQYLAANPNSVVYGTDETGSYRIPFYMLDGKVVAGPPVRTGGFFGWFSSWMKAPSPDEFAKIIK